VADEVEWIINRYNPDMLWIADDVFTIHQGWLTQFAAEMKRRRIRIPFECITRADRVNAQIADLLAELHCFRVWIGSESGSQRVLDAMQRGVTVEQVQTAVELCKSRGIETGMFLMWGYEGEQLEDIEATIQHVKRTRPDVFFTTVSYPIRGTGYYEKVAGRVASSTSWAAGSDRDFRIQGRHSRRFYQSADQLLRAEVEIDRLSNSTAPDSHINLVELRQKVEQARKAMETTFAETEA
jgi:anaerobic magnesium-protoporphyrin IX monomethyl ester cyclase